MTPHPPPAWPETCYIRPIELESGGQRAWTHLAELRPPDGPPCRAYIKHYPAQAPRGLFNEWFGHTLMHALGVPQPRAALMQAPVLALPGRPMAWAFVSCQPSPVFEGTPKQIYNIDKPEQHAQLVKRLFACACMPTLIAADQLLNNADRNLGNLVFTGKSSFVAIDHSDILGGCNWRTAEQWLPAQWSVSKLIEQLIPIDQVPQAAKQRLFVSSELVCDAFYEAQIDLKNAMNCPSHGDTQIAMDAVWWRTLALANWFKERLQLLV